MNDANIEEAIKRIRALAVGERFTIDDLLEDIWLDVGSGPDRRQFGSQFSYAVRRGEIPGCKWLGPQGTNRTVTYERVE